MQEAVLPHRERTAFSISSDDMNQDMYRGLREGAGLVERSSRGLIAIGGPDRADYLQGQLTNDIVALEDGHGCYAVHLTPNGRMIADMDVLSVGDRVLLDVDGGVKDSLVSRFQELIFTEDVVVSDWTESWTSYGVSGPRAPRVVAAAVGSLDTEGQPSLEALGDYEVARLLVGKLSLIVARTDALGMPGFSLWVEREGADSLREALIHEGCVEVDAAAADAVRIENGRPAFPLDLGDDVIPLEAGIEDRAISFTKGCYVGQEMIIRILHRGQGKVARRLTGLTLDSPGLASSPHVGALLWSGDKEVGRLTSVAMSPGVGSLVALGYVTREHLEPGTALEADAPSGRSTAVVTKLPFLS